MKKNYTKTLSLFMAMCISLSSYAAWNGDATAWTEGVGTEDQPYLIENEAQLSYFQQQITAGETYEGKFFRLTANLDMAGKKMPSIGHYNDYTTQETPGVVTKESKVFCGTFDGNNHTIDNLTIVSNNADSSLGGIGLFAITYPETHIKNLILGEKVTVDGTGFDCVGGFAGYGSGGVIENCRFMGYVKAGGVSSGGIVGASEQNTTIICCANVGRLTGFSFAGGIVGSTTDTKIQNCYSTAELSCPDGYWVGGIVGWAVESTINNCYSIGEIIAQPESQFLPGKSPICTEFENSTAADCYFVEALTGCKPLNEQAGVTAVTEDEMKSPEMIDKLNNNLSAEAWGQGANGFPALLWEINGSTGIESVATEAEFGMYKCGKRLQIVSASGENAQITVYDITGKAIMTTSVVNGDCIEMPVEGVCIVTATTSNGKRTAQKFVF